MRLAGVTASRASAAAGLPLDALTSGLVMPVSPHRRLVTSYTGSLIQIRRSQDSATQDIGYTGAGVLDEAALSTFVDAGGGPGGDGQITREYFQDGSGNYLQPMANPLVMYSFGAWNRSGNIPVGKAGAGADFSYVSNAAISLTGTTLSCYVGRSYGDAGAGEDCSIALCRADGWAIFGTDSVVPLYKPGATSNIEGYRNSAAVTTPIAVAGFFVAGARLDGTNLIVHAAGTTQSAASTGTLAVVKVARGSYNSSPGNGGNTNDNSLIGEMVLWSGDVGSVAMEAKMADYAAFMAS